MLTDYIFSSLHFPSLRLISSPKHIDIVYNTGHITILTTKRRTLSWRVTRRIKIWRLCRFVRHLNSEISWRLISIWVGIHILPPNGFHIITWFYLVYTSFDVIQFISTQYSRCEKPDHFGKYDNVGRTFSFCRSMNHTERWTYNNFIILILSFVFVSIWTEISVSF